MADYHTKGYDDFDSESYDSWENDRPSEYGDFGDLEGDELEAARELYDEGYMQAEEQYGEYLYRVVSVCRDQLESAVEPVNGIMHRGESNHYLRHPLTEDEYKVDVTYFPCVSYNYEDIVFSVESDLEDFLKREDLDADTRARAQADLDQFKEAWKDYQATTRTPPAAESEAA